MIYIKKPYDYTKAADFYYTINKLSIFFVINHKRIASIVNCYGKNKKIRRHIDSF